MSLSSHRPFAPLAGILATLLFIGSDLPLSYGQTFVRGEITEDTTWTPEGSPYEVANTTVLAHVTLTIESGTIVEFENYATLEVLGRIQAHGAADRHILFTSLSGAEEGAPWRGIRLSDDNGLGNGLGPSSLSYCVFEGGGDWYGCMLEARTGARVSVEHSLFRHSRTEGIRFYELSGGPITHTRFENNAGYGLWLRGSSPTVSDSSFSGNGNAARLESGDGRASFPQFVTTTFAGDDRVHIASNLDSGGLLTAAPYLVDGHRVANANETITIEGGASFAMANYSTFTIHGNLLAQGTEEAPITFTSLSGLEGGPWRAVQLTNGNGAGNGLPGSVLSHCTFEGGGDWYGCMLDVLNGAPASLDHCSFLASVRDGIHFLESSGGPISNTRFENNAGYGLWLRGSSPEVSNSTFSGNGNAVRLESGAGRGSFPAFSNTFFEGDDRVHIASHIDSGGTLSAAPYILDGHRVATSFETIIIDGGASFAMADYSTWTIYGNLLARGTENAPISFHSLSGPEGSPWRAVQLTNGNGEVDGLQESVLSHCTFEGGGDWYACMLDVLNGAAVSLDHCTFRDSVSDGIHFLENSGGPISDTLFENNAGYGLWLRGSSPRVTRCVFSGNGNAGRMESGAGPGSYPVFSGTVFNGDDRMHIASNFTTGGTLTAAPYYLDGHRVSTALETVTIEGGASFTMEDYSTFTIHGNLLAQGTSDAPILFTSASGAGENSPWRSLQLTNGNGQGHDLPASKLSYCTFEGGGDWYGCMLDVNHAAPVSLDHCTFRQSVNDGARFYAKAGGTITNCTFEDIAGYGLRLQGISAPISQNIFQRCGAQAVLLWNGPDQGDSFPVFSENTFGPTDYVEIGGNFHDSGHLSNPGQAYLITGTRSILPPANVTIASGTRIEFANSSALIVRGSLDAAGTQTAPILFTSDNEVKAPGQWRSLVYTTDRTRPSVLRHCVMEAGGEWYGALVQINGTPPLTVDSCTLRVGNGDGIKALGGSQSRIDFTSIHDCTGHGISTSQASITLQGCDLYHNAVSGLHASNATAEVANSVLRDNGRFGVWATGSPLPRISNSYIAGNVEQGILNQGSMELSAPNNWWGHPTGPHHPSLNPEGRGDTVSDRVLFEPYRVFASNVPKVLQDTLVNGVTVGGSFPQGVSGFYYAVEVPDGENLTLVVDDANDVGVTQVYLSRSGFPTPYDYQIRHETTAADQSLFVPAAGPGRWIALVLQFTSQTDSSYTIRADLAKVAVHSVTPVRHSNSIPFALSLEGAGFNGNTSVSLLRQGQAYAAQSTSLDSFTHLTANFAADSIPSGIYDVSVANQGEPPVVLPQAFEAIDGGRGKLVTRLIVPSAVGYHQLATLYVEYSNEGDASMIAPILLVDADQEGRRAALMTLHKEYLTTGFWTSSKPQGFSNTVKIMASGEQAGFLHPGESMRIPVYYAGWQKPWDFSYPPIQFSLGQLAPDSTAPIDWDNLKPGVKPDRMADDLFEALWANTRNTIGDTWGDYVTALAENAAHLDSMGSPTHDINALLAFELLQADALNPSSPLSQAVDTVVEAPGMPTVFSRTFFQGVSGRYRLGMLGRGWSTPWETSLFQKADGTISIESGPGRRLFQPDVRGGYLASPGDPGHLSKDGDGYLLLEALGERSRFHTDGTLDFIQNRNGVRIRCEYTNGRLSGLVHSRGARLTLTHLGNGRLASVSNPDLGSVAYTYDASGEHLLSVTDTDGRETSYAYQSSSSPSPRAHGLLSSTSAGRHEFFTYDQRGRLLTYHHGDPDQAYHYNYDSSGSVSVTDPAGHTSRAAYLAHGEIARIHDGNGNATSFSFDPIHRSLTSVQTPEGDRTNFLQDRSGNLKSVISAQGDSTQFITDSVGRLRSVIDALGNQTDYEMDSAGNVTALRRPDGTAESFLHDEVGDLLQWTNRRGQAILIDRDRHGRVIRSGTDDDPETFTYDARGNLIAAENREGTMIIDYTSGHLPSKVTFPGGRSVRYSYDAHGRRSAVIDDAGRATHYHYDDLGRLQRATDESDQLIVAYEFTPHNLLARRRLGNGSTTAYTYDEASRLISMITTDKDGGILFECTYERDIQGYPLVAQTIEGQWTYEYDALGQLTRARFASSLPELSDIDLSYQYDSMGNRTVTRSHGAEITYSSNSMNQYIRAGDTLLSHDADGNLVADAGPASKRAYRYDPHGRLLSAQQDTDLREFHYNALGHPIATTHNGVRTDYVIDIFRGGNVIAESSDGFATSTRFHYARGLESRHSPADLRHFFNYDGQGSVAALSDHSGAEINRYRYLPFGDSLLREEQEANPYQFSARSGTRREGDGLFWMHARFYRADLGRFLSEDTFFEPWQNAYTYARNNPLFYHDPTGETAVPVLTSQTEEELEFGYWRDWFNHGEGKKLAAEAVAGYSWGAAEYFFKGGAVGIGVLLVAKSNPVGWGVILGVAGWEYVSTRNSGIATRQHINAIFKDRNLRLKAFQFFKTVEKHYPQYYRELIGGKDLKKLLEDDPIEFIKKFHQAYQQLAQSMDPNQKIGPAGFGSGNFVAPGDLLPYRVDFENDKDAAAPAQVVMIRDPLSADLDWSTFELTEVGFGDHLIPVSGSSQSFEGTETMTYAGKNLEVSINIALEPVTGVITAIFSTTDTETGLPPEVQYGFLPPEDETGRGQGYFAYIIRAKAGLAHGTEIRNVATITFDFGEVIATNQVDPHDPSKGTDPAKEALITIDAHPPLSTMNPLPDISPARFDVSWSGEDTNGAGVGLYTVYVRADGGSFEPWLEDTFDTQAIFTGQNGVTYGFFVTSSDFTGNAELMKSAAEVATTVMDDGGPAANYASWLHEHFTEQEIEEGVSTNLEADADGDGRTNGSEFAFLTNPRLPDAPSLAAGWQDGRFVLRYWRHRAGIRYVLESSMDLKQWKIQADGTHSVLSTEGETEYLQLSLPSSATAVRYLRVRADW